MSERYVKMSKKMREHSGFTEEKLDKCISGLKIIIEALEEVQENKNTITGAFKKRNLNMLRTRTVMYDVGKIYEDEREGYGYGDDLELLAPIEKFYCEIFDLDPKTTAVNDFMPPDAIETVKQIFDNPEKYKLDARGAAMTYRKIFSEETYDEIAKEYNVTRERIRQLIMRTIRMLRHPVRSRTLRYGLEFEKYLEERYIEEKERIIEELLQKRIENDAEIRVLKQDVEPVKDITLEELELSLRSYNCLKRAGYNTLDDLKNSSEAQLMRCRNLGKKSLDEVAEKIKQYYPDWS